jgi:hypothetical protein
VVAVFQGGKQVHTTRQAQAAPVGVAI